MRVALTGDPELDAAVPQYPRVLPEISWIPLSPTKVLAAGSLNATLLPSRLGATTLLGLLERLNGANALAELIDEGNERHDEHRRYFRLLFRAGLLEDALGVGSAEPSFHPLAMDQTRQHRNRVEAIVASQRPVLVLGASGSALDAFRAAGINVDQDNRTTEFAFQVVMLEPSGDLAPGVELDPKLPALPVRMHGNAVDIGPWLVSRGGCALSDLQRYTASNAPVHREVVSNDIPLLEALSAHTISLIVAGTSPIVIASTLYRISVTAIGPVTERIPVSPLAYTLTEATESLKQRLEARAESAMPTLRHVGTKSHEAHHSPRNLLASLEIQEGGVEPISVLPGLGSHASASIMRILAAAFGYTRSHTGQLRRNCPSGGNLGSPEPLVWLAEQRRVRVYRYLAITGQLECVLESFRTADGPPEVGIICLGNKEKMSRKYGRFSDTLVQLDGGVARAFLVAAAQAEGISMALEPPGHTPPEIAALVRDRSFHYKPLWSVRVHRASRAGMLNPMHALTRRRLAKAVSVRRAIRTFQSLGTTPKRYAQEAIRWRPGGTSELERELSGSLDPILRVRSNGKQGFYRIGQDGSLEKVASRAGGPELFLQRSLDQAPFALFFLASLAPIVGRHGEKGLDAILLLAGQWVGKLWLELGGLGLGGCPCGAAVESDLLEVLPPSYDGKSLLFSFVAGKPGK